MNEKDAREVAITTLVGIAKDANTPAAERIGAACAIFDHAHQLPEVEATA